YCPRGTTWPTLANGATRPPAPSATTGRDHGSGMDPWAALCPGQSMLELRSDAQQNVFTSVRGDELHADRQAGRVPTERQRNRGLARDVERGREGDQWKALGERAQRIVGGGGELADPWWRRSDGRCHEQIESVLPPARHAPRVNRKDLQRLEVPGGGDASPEPRQRPRRRLDVFSVDRPAELAAAIVQRRGRPRRHDVREVLRDIAVVERRGMGFFEAVSQG